MQTERTTEEGGGQGGRHPSSLVPGGAGHRRGRRRWLWLGGVLVGLGILSAVFAFGLSRDPTFVRSPLLSQPAPDFTLRTLDGAGTVRLARLRGQVVVVNFWASWCAACRTEHPSFVTAWKRYRDQGVVFLGIVEQDSAANATKFLGELGEEGETLLDPGGTAAIAFGVFGIPETFFIDRAGFIRYKQTGASSYQVLTDAIQSLLEQPTR